MEAIFLKIDGVPGDSQVSGHEDQMEILAFSHGVSQQVTSDVSNKQRTSGRPNHQDLNITKYIDNSSPIMNQDCCKGVIHPEAVLTITRNDEGEVLDFLVITLKDVIISQISIGGSGGGKPTENISLNYSHITWEVKVQEKEGGSSGGNVGTWNLATNKED